MYKAQLSEIRQNNTDPNHYTVDNVGEAAELLLKVKPLGVPVKIIQLCKEMGFNIYQQDLPSEICGYIAIDGELKDKLGSDKIISVNENESNKRRRFTVAHELGHYLFNFDPATQLEFFNKFERNPNEDDTNEATSDEECIANRFAAELLMPKEIFTKKYTEYVQNAAKTLDNLYEIKQQLSDDFLVPPKAVQKRIDELELDALQGEQ